MITEIFKLFVFPGLISAIFIGFLYWGLIRKFTARMQNRIGPPIWQPFFDWVKLMSKEDIKTKYSNFICLVSPIISFSSTLTVTIFIPILGNSLISFFGDVLLVIYLLVISTLMFALAGFASGSGFGYVGGIREITQMFSYELPFIISLLTIGFVNNFSIKPFFAISFPFALLSFIFYIIAELNLPPFHIPDSEQEIVSGSLTEYSGRKLAMFFLAKSVKLWVLLSIGAVYFLGAKNIIWFFINSFILLFIIILIRVIFARLRLDHMFRFFWFVLTPLALIDLLRAVTGFWWSV